MSKGRQSLRAGEWSDTLGGDWYEIRNPADGREVVAEVPAMDGRDVARALEAATVGARRWRATSIVERGEVLRRAAALVRERREEIARDVTLEMGKLINEARGETAKAGDFLEYYAGFGRRPLGQVLPDTRPGAEARTIREPRGVVVAITPWNDPVITPARKLCPALISGNAVVLKPAPESPLSALHLARALEDAGLPAGVLNLVTGPGDEVARQLVKSDGFHTLSFTGSTEVGLGLQKELAGRGIAVQTEMGGKNAAVVMADANPKVVVEALLAGAFVQAGQRCTATSRVLVESAKYQEIVERFASGSRRLRVGPGLNEQTEMGPLVAESRLEAVLASLDQARSGGAELITGGERLREGGLTNGWFMAPTVVGDCEPGSSLWQEELFAPVVAFAPADSLESAIEVVNSTRYGLAASIFTKDLEAAHRFAEGVDVGCVAVNLPTAGWDVHMPFGGFKDSGSAFKEQGENALDFYCRVKTIATRSRDI